MNVVQVDMQHLFFSWWRNKNGRNRI